MSDRFPNGRQSQREIISRIDGHPCSCRRRTCSAFSLFYQFLLNTRGYVFALFFAITILSTFITKSCEKEPLFFFFSSISYKGLHYHLLTKIAYRTKMKDKVLRNYTQNTRARKKMRKEKEKNRAVRNFLFLFFFYVASSNDND